MASASTLDLYVAGSRAWFPDQADGWISADLVSRQVANGKIFFTFTDERDNERVFESSLSSLKDSDLPPLRNPPLLEQTEDLTNLSYLNEPAVLHAIKTRYSVQQIYTYSGIVLVAVNPFASVPLYDSSFVQTYAGRRKSDLEPHLFAIAEEAYRCMVQDGRDQTIIVSGESGAGKTVSAKYIMRFFATVENPDRPRKKVTSKDGMTDVERQILATNPVMEAFGNAKTTRNDNSSRFGKFIEIMFDRKQLINGARLRTYLLERSRLAFQPETERNYHIFYQFLAGAPKSDLAALDLDEPSQFHYLSQGGPSSYQIPNVDDGVEFANTQKSLSTIGVTSERQWHIFKLLAALLHLGNIDITQVRNDATISDNDAALQRATQLLGIDLAEFKKWTVKKQITTRTEKIASSLTAAQATVVRDSVAKYIYAQLFDWLVHTINESLTSPETAKKTRSFIGVLDIYGFEHFNKNSFEQFCINYANEKLQQQFNAQVFKIEQNEYTQEEINWTFIDFSDNQPCIDLIEGKLGILSLLDEESRLPAGSDPTFAQKLYSNLNKPEQNNIFRKPKFGNTAFTVAHYALDVTYETEGFLEKNRDTVPDEHLALLNTTTNPFLKEVLDSSKEREKAAVEQDTNGNANEKESPGTPNKRSSMLGDSTNKRSSVLGGVAGRRGGNSGKKPTLGSIFKLSLNELMKTIGDTNAHYIRCIKPNEEKKAWELEPQMVLGQLRACGVLETIRISTAGYPTRWTFEEFAERYYMLTKSENWGPDLLGLCRIILEASITEPDKYQIGRTKIFFRAGMLAFMEKLRTERITYLVTLMQKNVRREINVKSYQRTRASIISLQSIWKSALTRTRIQREKEEKSAVMIQTAVRGALRKAEFLRLRSLVLFIQGSTRKRVAKLQFEEQRLGNAVSTVQSLIRSSKFRKSFASDRRRTVFLQSCTRRDIAKRELARLKTESKSASHYKEVSYRLENKVVELTQTLQKRTTENKSLQQKLRDLDNQLTSWQEKYSEVDKEASALREEASKPIESLPEFQDLEAQRRELNTRLEESLSKIELQNDEIKSLKEEFEKQAGELQARPKGLSDGSTNGFEDTETVTNLKAELASLREQLSRAVAMNNIERSNRPLEQPSFNMATGKLSTAVNGVSPTNGTFPPGVAGAAPGAGGVSSSRRRQRRHSLSELPSDLGNGQQDGEFAQERRDIRAVSVAHAQDQHRVMGGSAAYAGEEQDEPADDVIGILLDEESLDQDVLNLLIQQLKIPSAIAQNPPSPKEVLFPAHLISLVTNEMWKYSLLAESERFLANVMQYVQNKVMSYSGEDAIAPGTFWQTNVREVFSFVAVAEGDVMRGVGPGSEEEDFDWDDYERLVKIVKQDLESLEYNIYHTWMQETKKRLAKMIIPAVLESQSLPGFVVNEGGGGKLFNRLVGGGPNQPAYSMDDIISLFTRVYKCLVSYYVEEDITKQALEDLFKLIGVTAFNELLTRRNFCSWKRAMQIQYNLTRMEEWCKTQKVPECSMPLEHLMQATKLLQLKKGTSNDVEIIYDVCWMLTPTQIHKLMTQYTPAGYENAIPPEIIKQVRSRVVPGDESDHLLLPPELEAPDAFNNTSPRVVTGIETYIPGWLPLEHIRKLVVLVSS